MLPFALSNGICSLNPKVDRLAFSALMEVDKDGRRYGAKFAKSVIRSKARMTYNEVNKILAGDKGLREEYALLVETAETMNDLAHALYKRRIERGALELDIPEAEIRVDENGKPVEIRFRERGESEKLIEEFMSAGQRSGCRVYVQARAADRLPCARESRSGQAARVCVVCAVRSATASTRPSRRIRRSSRPCCAAQRTTRSSACCRRFCCARWRVPATRMSASAITA